MMIQSDKILLLLSNMIITILFFILPDSKEKLRTHSYQLQDQMSPPLDNHLMQHIISTSLLCCKTNKYSASYLNHCTILKQLEYDRSIHTFQYIVVALPPRPLPMVISGQPICPMASLQLKLHLPKLLEQALLQPELRG